MQEWEARWAEGRIGFHRETVNPTLEQYAHAVFGPPPARVLVPLCGKSLDLIWLREQGYDVVGVEGVRLAIEGMSETLGSEPVVETVDGHRIYQWGRLKIVEADILALNPNLLGPFDGAWDRAALVALNAADRGRYAAQMCAMLRHGASVLLRALSYDQSRMEGPPYSVTMQEVEEVLYRNAEVNWLEQSEGETRASFQERGVMRMCETTARIVLSTKT